MNYFDAKDTSEKVVLTFDFSPGLDAGETLQGAISVTVESSLLPDLTPDAILNGAALFDSSSTKVYQPVQGGVTDADYIIKVVVDTSNSQKTLAINSVLPIRR